MLEFIGCFITLVATIFVRKQDIVSFINDKDSVALVEKNILYPDQIFRNRMRNIGRLIDLFLEKGYRFYFSIFMMSLLYTSLSFVLSLHFEAPKNVFFNDTLPVENMRLAGLSFILSAPVIMIIGKVGARMVKPMYLTSARSDKVARQLNKLRQRANITIFNLFSGALVAYLAYATYSSLLIGIFTLAVSLSNGLRSKNFHHWMLYAKDPASVFAGATLGTWGLILVTFSFAAENISLLTTFFGIGLAISSGGLALFGTHGREAFVPDGHPEFVPATPSWSPKGIASYIGRPSLFVSFYCGRCSGQFCITIALILANVIWARSFLPDAVVTAGAVMLACFVFFSGATTVAGAGVFAFGLVGLIAIYMIFQPTLLFTVWPPSFMLWILFPVITSTLDWGRWLWMRRNIDQFVKTGKLRNAGHLLADIAVALACYLAFVFAVFFFLFLFNRAGGYFGYPPYFPAALYLAKLQEAPLSNGLWLIIMATAIFVPSILQFVLFAFSGYTALFSDSYRRRLSTALRSPMSVYEVDRLAWQIAAFDILGRAIFAAVVLGLAIYAGLAAEPLFERLTVSSATYGSLAANSFASWLEASR